MRRRVLLDPVAVRLDTPQLIRVGVDIIKGAVALCSQVCGCVGKGALGWEERSLGSGCVEVGLSAPRLHIGVSLIKQEITRNNSNNKQNSAEEVWKQVRELREDASRRKERGEVICWFGKVSTD